MASLRFLLAAVLVAVARAAHAAPSGLDPAWGTGGVVSLGEGTVYVAELEADGTLWLASALGADTEIARLDRQGHDATLPRILIRAPESASRFRSMNRRPDGRIDVVWKSDPFGGPFWTCRRTWHHYTTTGESDPTFGNDGVKELGNSCSGTNLVVARDGTAYAVDAFAWFGGYNQAIERYAPDGSRIANLGVQTNAGPPPPWYYRSVVVDSRDRAVAVLGDWRDWGGAIAVRRFDGAAPDSTFGTDGIAVSIMPGASTRDAVPLDDGGILAIGTASAGPRTDVVLVRFDERGRPDPSFGVGGVARVPFAHEEQNYSIVLAKPMRDGRIVVAATLSEANASPSRQYSRIARLTAAGMLDERFAGGGIASLNGTSGLVLSSLHVRPTGEIVVVGRGLSGRVVEQRLGGDLAVPHPLREREVVEYLHSGYGHYVMTADELEIASLDAGSAWRRTGQRFNAFDSAGAPLVPVCRFWSYQTYAPKSSHFYTPYAAECDRVKADTAWMFEGTAFHLGLPAGQPGGATCGADLRPLYRAYNNGQSGAPNHRYTTDPAVLDAMLAQGWTMEGERDTRVFACVPLAD